MNTSSDEQHGSAEVALSRLSCGNRELVGLQAGVSSERIADELCAFFREHLVNLALTSGITMGHITSPGDGALWEATQRAAFQCRGGDRGLRPATPHPVALALLHIWPAGR